MDKINTVVGKVTMYLIFPMMAILLFESVSRSFFDSPNLWTMEMAQFTMAAYYLLGGGFALILHSHVRMDVLYSRWFTRKQAKVDAFTSIFLIFYLVVLLYGGISSTAYSIEYDQRNYSAWSPPLAPIKIIMVIGIVLTLLQAIAFFFKDLAKARGEKLS
ncbi:MAG: TRAP transporter small permease subunit [Desulfocurvibacter africanus]